MAGVPGLLRASCPPPFIPLRVFGPAPRCSAVQISSKLSFPASLRTPGFGFPAEPVHRAKNPLDFQHAPAHPGGFVEPFRFSSCSTFKSKVAGVPGFEPGNAGVKVPCLTAWLHPNIVESNSFSSGHSARITPDILSCALRANAALRRCSNLRP